MRLPAAAFVFAVSVHAAVIQGVVLDEETGNPLARTLVTLTPLPGTQAGSISLRAGERGAFTILSVRPGWYVLKTSRRGFADAEAGQVRPGRPGMPFEVTGDALSSFFQIRMRHLAAMTGAVLDENNEGIPDWPVHVYTAKKPVRRIDGVKTDERGNFRVGGLDPGLYVVRSGPGLLEDESPLLATYYKYGTALETAETARLRLGETLPDVFIRATKGKLLQLSGIFNSFSPAHLTLITDTGRRQIAAAGPLSPSVPFEATDIPPGPVEFVAEGDAPGAECGGYTRLIADKDTGGIRIGCGPLYRPGIDWQGARSAAGTPILARRVDLDGTGPVRTLRTDQPLAPGQWELTLQPPAQYYLVNIRSQFGGEPATRNDGWFGLSLGNMARLQIVLSSRPGTVSGVVSAGGKPVAGASVYLELYNPDAPEIRLRLWNVRSDAEGNYTFAQLAPGHYRALSSFDFDPEDPFAMEKAVVLTLNEGETATKALDMLLP
ncbi:MAG: carboxypeptidase-like regulatory domain-containing protein [Acidobacteriota bacterium]